MAGSSLQGGEAQRVGNVRFWSSLANIWAHSEQWRQTRTAASVDAATCIAWLDMHLEICWVRRAAIEQDRQLARNAEFGRVTAPFV